MAVPIEGLFGRAVRLIADVEFDLILKTGFETSLAPAPIAELELPSFADEPATFDRPVVERVTRGLSEMRLCQAL
jgi:hypothetical protein